MNVGKHWCTTPAVCNTCGNTYQMVFEANIIEIDDEESWELPTDIICNQCGSNDITFTDFENKKP